MSSATATSTTGVRVTHPNRGRPEVRATRAMVIALLLISAGMVLVVTVGGWEALQGGVVINLGFVAVYLVFAYYAARWTRGALPIASVLAVLLAVFALVSGPAWFQRDHAGFAQPSLPAGLLGLVTLLIVPVQILLVGFAMRGFGQGWNVELERRDPSLHGEDPGAVAPRPA
jgi:lysylphosphatidylglycerol synthetase-like protein (DUF2156 family)